MEIICSCCNKKFEKRLSKVNEAKKYGWKSFCSVECQAEGKKTGNRYDCAFCNKEVYKSKSASSKTKSGNVFCNRSCATSFNNKEYKSGENNPNWIDGAGSYRVRALAHYGIECRICGYNVKAVLEVHHIDKNRGNNQIENLIVVCPTHHKEYHLGLIKQ